MNINFLINNIVREHTAVTNELLEKCGDQITRAAEILIKTLRVDKGTVYICGNGGSAADAQHMAAELIGRFKTNRAPFPAVSLSADSSVLTAIANDFGYEEVFARQLKGMATSKDCLIAISTSGNSENVCNAIRIALDIGMRVIALTNNDSQNRIWFIGITKITVPSCETARVQEMHLLIEHILCQAVDNDSVYEKSTVYSPDRKLLTRNQLGELRTSCNVMQKTIVWTNGVFDLLHSGHVISLQQAKAIGDILVVGVNSDQSAETVKDKKPIIPELDRFEILRALECVDYIHIFDEVNPIECLKTLAPNFYCKGEEYKNYATFNDEIELMDKLEGKVVFLKRGIQSTSKIISKIRGGL